MDVVEPILALDDIQGNILAGFRKDYQRFVFGAFGDEQVKGIKAWLAHFVDEIASAQSVGAFNTAFRLMRAELQREPRELQVLWRNIAFTRSGLEKLIGVADVAKFTDQAFLGGASTGAPTIGDPSDGSPGDPRTWDFGSGIKVPDFVVVLAADDASDVQNEQNQVASDLQSITTWLHIEEGHTRPAAPGHEHFGYKDGISQPGIRGRTSATSDAFFTPREFDANDPNAKYFAAPGLPLVWPGEFLLNLPRQKGGNSDPIDSITTVDGPPWATNGSFLVFRKLHQDVAVFNAMVEGAAQKLSAVGKVLTPDQVGAMIVGRFKSGAPIMRVTVDDSALANDVYASNNFFFENDTPVYKLRPGSGISPDTFPAATADIFGARCPFAAHIRKVNPRDESTDFGAAPNTLQHRILRRGIPYGNDYTPATADEDRGLLFVGYVSSIGRQFHDLIRVWVNSPDQPDANAGLDPVIGQDAPRQMIFHDANGQVIASVAMGAPVVIAKAAAYFFSPSKSAIRSHLAAG